MSVEVIVMVMEQRGRVMESLSPVNCVSRRNQRQ
jgi:hypothetical protein